VKRSALIIVLAIVALAVLGGVWLERGQDLQLDVPSPDPELSNSASSERECRDYISARAAHPPNLDPIEGILGDGPSDGAIDRAYGAATRWSGVIAETYECAAEFGPLTGGDKVLAEHAAALYLVRLELGPDPGLDAVIKSAMVGIQDLYSDSCFAASAETWVQEDRLDIDQMSACGVG
jgi:hypothetical protein